MPSEPTPGVDLTLTFVHFVGLFLGRSSIRKFAAIAFGLTLVGLISMPPSHLFAYSGEKFAKDAKITIDQARAIALQTRAGTITDEELEHEKGGSGLRYSFVVHMRPNYMVNRPACLGSGARRRRSSRLQSGSRPHRASPGAQTCPLSPGRDVVGLFSARLEPNHL